MGKTEPRAVLQTPGNVPEFWLEVHGCKLPQTWLKLLWWMEYMLYRSAQSPHIRKKKGSEGSDNYFSKASALLKNII